MAFANRLVIVAGGLGGLGSVTASLLRAQGAKLALFHHPSEAHNVAPVLRDVFDCDISQHDVRTYPCDIVSSTSVDAAFQAVSKDQLGFPSILINAAGYVTLGPLETFPVELVKKHYDINLLGPTLTGQAFARMYLAAVADRTGSPETPSAIPGGRIVNIASQAAHVALAQHGPYCASKAGLLGLTRSMASEWASKGITANSISPGPVMTALGKSAWADENVKAEYLAAVPTGHFAEPIQVAKIAEFLCRDESANINGADIRLDGGFTAR